MAQSWGVCYPADPSRAHKVLHGNAPQTWKREYLWKIHAFAHVPGTGALLWLRAFRNRAIGSSLLGTPLCGAVRPLYSWHNAVLQRRGGVSSSDAKETRRRSIRSKSALLGKIDPSACPKKFTI